MTEPALATPAPRTPMLTWALVLALVAVGGYFVLRAWRGLPDETNPSRGDFEHFYYAAKAAAAGEDIYQSHTKGYIYPPLLATLLRPLAPFDLRPAQMVWAASNLAIYAAIVLLTLRELRKRLGMPTDPLTLAAVTTLGVAIGFEPLRQEIEEGQTDTLVCFGMFLAMVWLERLPVLAGLALGFAANIKYQALIVLPYLLVRRRFTAALSTAIGVVAFALLPALVIGWSKNLDGLARSAAGVARLLGARDLSGPAVATHDIRWEKSISITSGFAKMFGPDVSDKWAFAAAGLVGLGILGILWGAGAVCVRHLAGRKQDASQPEPDLLPHWCGLMLAVLIFSPQTTIRHAMLALPAYLVAAWLIVRDRHAVARTPLGPRGPILIGTAAFVLGILLPPGNVEAFKPALDAWRTIGGSGWVMAVLAVCLMWSARPPEPTNA